jgi:hypothetical protein
VTETITPETTRVRFLRGGVPLSEAAVPGMLLELDLPKSITVRRSGPLVDLVESPDPMLECCGDILLPWASRQDIGIQRMRVDVPMPFSNDNLRVMWEARNRIRERHRPPTSGEAPWATLRAEDRAALSWRELRRAAEAALHLLATWPKRTTPAVSWLPLEQPGRTILVSVTERHTRQHAVVLPHGIAPTRTARRFAAREERRLQGLSTLATLAAQRVSEYSALDKLPSLRRDLASLFQRVAVRSRPAHRTTDPPPSTWPPQMASSYVSLLRALTAMRDEGAGQTVAPLSELWELYQAWVADQLVEGLTEILGQPVDEFSGGTSLARWSDGATATVELRYQPLIPSTPDTVGVTFLGVRLLAVIGNLQPDLMLVRREQNTWHAVIVDAKKRSGSLLSEDLSVEASKYLWGVRQVSTRQMVPALEGVILAAPLGGVSATYAEGLATVMSVHPSTGWNGNDVLALLDLVRGTSNRALVGRHA